MPDHVCPTCRRTFDKLNRLTRHQRAVHTGEKPFLCEKCGTAFARNDHLKRHCAAAHVGARRFACNACGAAFIESHHLKRHALKCLGNGGGEAEQEGESGDAAEAEPAPTGGRGPKRRRGTRGADGDGDGFIDGCNSAAAAAAAVGVLAPVLGAAAGAGAAAVTAATAAAAAVAARLQPAPVLNFTNPNCTLFRKCPSVDEWLPGMYVAQELWPYNVSRAPLAGIEQVAHITPFPETYFQSDWGLRWVASLSAKLYIDYYEFTRDQTFLATRAYPWVRDAAKFYRAYATRAADGLHYDLLYTCAQEGCSMQGNYSAVALSHNAPTDLAFARAVARKASEYSALLGVDADLRAGWDDLVLNLAHYPITHDPASGAPVLSQVNGTGDGVHDGFPWASATNASIHYYGNARYPISYFGPIHPAEELSLSSDAALLAIARTTVDVVNGFNNWIATNGLCLSWPSASRVSANASVTLGKFQAAMQLPGIMQANGWPLIRNQPDSGSGCPAEQAGGMVAVNDLFVTAHERVPGGAAGETFLRYFPAGPWPGAAFVTLRTRGAFLASGGAGPVAGAPPAPLHLISLVGGRATLLGGAWGGRGGGAFCVRGRSAGGAWSPVNVSAAGDGSLPLWAWETQAGDEYEASACTGRAL